LPHSDTQCGSKVFKSNVFISVAQECETMGFEFDVELLWRMKKHGYNIQEVGIEWANHGEQSKVNVSNAFSMLYNLLKVRVIN
jgi:hypothetical protein